MTESTIWTLQKDANKATATTRTVAGVGVELRYEFNGEVRQSQVYKDTDELAAAASHRRDGLNRAGLARTCCPRNLLLPPQIAR